MAITDPEHIIHRELVTAINEAFARAYPGAAPVDLPQELIRRVKMLSDDLHCTRQNWKATEKAYVALDCKLRGIRQHWWQFWRRPSQR